MSTRSHANVAVFVPHLGCPNRCSFCNQHTISGQQEAPEPEQVRQICAEGLRQLGDRAGESEIAFFGGSFTAIAHDYMISLLEAAQPFVGAEGFGGIRVSTRPDAVDAETLRLLKEYGVTTIELGAQSMDDGVLAKNLRGHTARDVEEASGRIRSMGFRLGLQMMTGLYGQSEESAVQTAEKLISLCPDMVRIYPTVVLKGTMLAHLWEQGLYQPQTVEQAARLGARLLDLFEEKNIPVIRLGLHASREVERQMLGGGYHPALRELCESERFLKRMRVLLRERCPGGGAMTVYVSPGDLSKALGQRRKNIELLAGEGWQVTVRPSPHVPRGSVDSSES